MKPLVICQSLSKFDMFIFVVSHRKSYKFGGDGEGRGRPEFWIFGWGHKRRGNFQRGGTELG